jgi:hypothetical protein
MALDKKCCQGPFRWSAAPSGEAYPAGGHRGEGGRPMAIDSRATSCAFAEEWRRRPHRPRPKADRLLGAFASSAREKLQRRRIPGRLYLSSSRAWRPTSGAAAAGPPSVRPRGAVGGVARARTVTVAGTVGRPCRFEASDGDQQPCPRTARDAILRPCGRQACGVRLPRAGTPRSHWRDGTAVSVPGGMRMPRDASRTDGEIKSAQLPAVS